MLLRKMTAILLSLAALIAGTGPATADVIPATALTGVGMQRYWETRLPMEGCGPVVHVSMVDENLYVLTETNRVFAVHAPTGVLRWSATVADFGQTVRGPTHGANYAFFTTPGGVRVFHRASGDPAKQPRALRGVVIDVAHDIAEINLGELHGVHRDDVLSVHRVGAGGVADGPALAQLRILTVQPRYSKGRLVRYEASAEIRPGDRAVADVVLPSPSVRLPFAASSAATADDTYIYLGAANQRFYCLEILTGFQRWQLRTPRTVTATPVLLKDNLYFAGQDGQVVSCTKSDRVENWIFKTEGPIFAELEVTDQHVFVASSDRSLYCLDRATGERRWRERFDNALDARPVAANGTVYQQIPNAGLYAVEIATGKRLWHRPSVDQFLMQTADAAYLWTGRNGGSCELVAVNPQTGEELSAMYVPQISFAAASQPNQSVLMITQIGEMVCLRPKDAPRLKPEELAIVLRNDHAAAIGAELDAKLAKAEPAKPVEMKKPRWSYLMDDLFRSSTDVEEAQPRRPAKRAKPAEDEGEEAEADEGDEDAADAEGDEEASDAEEGDEESTEEDAESEDEESSDEETDEESEEEDSEDEGDDNGNDNDGR